MPGPHSWGVCQNKRLLIDLSEAHQVWQLQKILEKGDTSNNEDAASDEDEDVGDNMNNEYALDMDGFDDLMDEVQEMEDDDGEDD